MFKNPFGLRGQICRLEYFLSGLIHIVGFSILFGLVGLMLTIEAQFQDKTLVLALMIIAIGTLGIAVFAALVWFGIAQVVKRFHDLNRSGWFIFLLLIPLVGAIVSIALCFMPGNLAKTKGSDRVLCVR